jgi:glycosyltransferase involved in cell wall biosynthesis
MQEKFDIGVLLYSTDFSYMHSEQFLENGIQHVDRLKNVAGDIYVLTIDSRDYSRELSAVHIPLGVTMRKYLKHLSYLKRSFSSVRQIIRENRDKRIVLVGRTYLAGMVLGILSRLYSVPSVVYFQYDWVSWKKSEGHIVDYYIAKIAEKVSLLFSTMIIATTPTLKEKVITRGFDPSRVHVVPNHVDISIFKPADKAVVREELGIDLSEKNMLFAGRLVPQKNLFNLLEALSHIEGVKLYIAGDGELKNELIKFAEKKGLSNQVRFLGAINQNLLVKYMQVCDIFVFPSLYEGHPKALVEAMACGCAIAASNVEGNNDVIDDNETGLLFNPEDPEDIAQKIKILMENPEIATGLKNNALKASKKYDIANILSEEKKIFLSLMG